MVGQRVVQKVESMATTLVAYLVEQKAATKVALKEWHLVAWLAVLTAAWMGKTMADC